MHVKEKNGSGLHKNVEHTEHNELDRRILEAFAQLTDEHKTQIIDSAIRSLFAREAFSSDRLTGTEANL